MQCTFYTIHHTRAVEHIKPACTHNTLETTPVNMIQLKSEISLTAPYTQHPNCISFKTGPYVRVSVCKCVWQL